MSRNHISKTVTPRKNTLHKEKQLSRLHAYQLQEETESAQDVYHSDVVQNDIPAQETSSEAGFADSSNSQATTSAEITTQTELSSSLAPQKVNAEKSSYMWKILGGTLVLGGGAALLAGGGSGSKKDGSAEPTVSDNKVSTSTNESEKVEMKVPDTAVFEKKPVAILSYDSTIFKQDSDKDGLIDAQDRNPHNYDVSERDLRLFSTLSYQSEAELQKAFNANIISELNQINKNPNGFDQALTLDEVELMVTNWDLLKYTNTSDLVGSGLDYSVFGNGKKEDGSYENIVFAFRGSKGQILPLQDFLAAFKVYEGNIPTQAKQLENVTSLIDKYNPDNIYATGHSLGGYLTQYFTGYLMQTKPEYADKMKHSAIFNPLKVIANENSSEQIIAKENTNKFVTEEILNPDLKSSNILYKTNSYVINGEFLADGAKWGIFSFTKGHGVYDNAVRFTPQEGGWYDSHKMKRFYEKTEELATHFSFGSRMDSYLENSYLKDSDKDGISDAIETMFHSNPHSDESTPATVSVSIGDKHMQLDTIVLHKLNDQAVAFKGNFANEHILGNSKNNVLDGGEGANYLKGAEGQDIFVLGTNNWKDGDKTVIADFEPEQDKLDLSHLRSLFDKETSWHDVFQKVDQNNTGLFFDKEAQTLNYQDAQQVYTVAHFMNQIEVTANHLIG